MIIIFINRHFLNEVCSVAESTGYGISNRTSWVTVLAGKLSLVQIAKTRNKNENDWTWLKLKVIFVAATQTRRHKLVVRNNDDNATTMTTISTEQSRQCAGCVHTHSYRRTRHLRPVNSVSVSLTLEHVYTCGGENSTIITEDTTTGDQFFVKLQFNLLCLVIIC
jgi:hypothetical protein